MAIEINWYFILGTQVTWTISFINQVLVLPKAFWIPFERNKGNHNSIHVFVLLVTSFPKDIHAVLGMSLIAGCWLHCNFTGWKRLSPWLKLLWKTKTWGQLKGAVKSKIQLDQNKGCLASLSYILAVLFCVTLVNEKVRVLLQQARGTM